jgi:hypothetical protein
MWFAEFCKADPRVLKITLNLVGSSQWNLSPHAEGHDDPKVGANKMEWLLILDTPEHVDFMRHPNYKGCLM